MPHNDATEWGREGGFIANDVLKTKKVIDSKFMNYHLLQIHFRFLLQPICAGKTSVVIIIDK